MTIDIFFIYINIYICQCLYREGRLVCQLCRNRGADRTRSIDSFVSYKCGPKSVGKERQKEEDGHLTMRPYCRSFCLAVVVLLVSSVCLGGQCDDDDFPIAFIYIFFGVEEEDGSLERTSSNIRRWRSNRSRSLLLRARLCVRLVHLVIEVILKVD